MKIPAFTLCFVLLCAHSATAFSFSEAKSLYDTKQFETLEKNCQEELAKNKNLCEALYFLVNLRLDKNKLDEAIPYMEQFEKAHDELEKAKAKAEGLPADVNFILMDAYFVTLYYDLGMYYFNKRNCQKADWWLTRASAVYLKNPELNFALATCKLKSQAYKEAKEYYHKQLKFSPDDSSPLYNIALYNIARIYALENNEQEAINWLKKAIAKRTAYKEKARNDRKFDSIRESHSFLELVGP